MNQVTTTTVTHASPASTYAHVSNRDFECDSNVAFHGKNPLECEDIASQLVGSKPGRKLKVVLGGGRAKFTPKSQTDADGNDGDRLDERNLIEEWKQDKRNAEYVNDKNGLRDIDYEKTEYLLGLFSSGHMSFNLDADREKEPTLIEMTEAAIKLLQKEKNGYFIFVEGIKSCPITKKSEKKNGNCCYYFERWTN